MSDVPNRLLDAAFRGDTRSGTKTVMALIDAGASLTDVIEDVLAPVQREVGERWLRNEWSVADEHRVTAVVDAALAAAALSARLPTPTLGRMLCVCAEGEWHTIAARMGAALLSSEGWEVIFLGGSVPPLQLADALRFERPDAVGIHVSLPMHLPGAARTVDVARAADLHVAVAGRAVDGSPQRASALRATHTVERGRLVAIEPGNGAAPGDEVDLVRTEVDLVSASEDEIVNAAYQQLVSRDGVTAELSASHRQRTVEDLRYMVRHLTAAAALGDPTIWTDFYRWLVDVLVARGVPEMAAERGFEAVAEALRPTAPKLVSIARDT